jgi:hypothetical protein
MSSSQVTISSTAADSFHFGTLPPLMVSDWLVPVGWNGMLTCAVNDLPTSAEDVPSVAVCVNGPAPEVTTEPNMCLSQNEKSLVITSSGSVPSTWSM